jgi:hypothetical protein
MSSQSSETNGYATQDTAGAEGRQEAEGWQEHLQQQTRANAGGSQRKRDRIVYVENSSNVRDPFVIEEVGSVTELIDKICEKFPSICLEMMGMKVCSARPGVIHRKVFEDALPYEVDTLYISLYLKKHTPYYAGKIEPNQFS